MTARKEQPRKSKSKSVQGGGVVWAHPKARCAGWAGEGGGGGSTADTRRLEEVCLLLHGGAVPLNTSVLASWRRACRCVSHSSLKEELSRAIAFLFQVYSSATSLLWGCNFGPSPGRTGDAEGKEEC